MLRLRFERHVVQDGADELHFAEVCSVEIQGKERFADRIDWGAVEKIDELKRKLDFELIMKID